MTDKELIEKAGKIMATISTWHQYGILDSGHPEEEPDYTLEGLWNRLLPIIKKEFGDSPTQ